MMAGNPNPSSWWSMHNTPDLMIRSSPTAASDHHQAAVVDHDHAPPPNFLSSLSQTHPNSNSSLFPLHEYLSSSSNSKSSSSSSPPSSSPSSFLALTSLLHHHHHQQQQQQLPNDFPHSWSQLLLGGLGTDQEEKYGANVFQSTRSDVKQEEISQRNITNNGSNNDLYGYNNDHEEQEAGISDRLAIVPPPIAAWSSQNMPISSPRSCVTTLSSNSNMLDFSITNKRSLQPQSTTYQHVDHSNSECNSSGSGGVPKKPRVQSSSNPPLKVRKEKLGDRITALHQLVSPFGKTDTASVLLEAIGYIRFLQAQIQALSSPYLGNSNNAAVKNQHSDTMDAPKGLRSRGLCLVPTSCTHLVGNDNGADYWAQIQSLGGGF